MDKLLIAVGIVLAGVVGYKIIKKKNPEWIDKTKKALSNSTKGVTKVIDGAKQSFREGFASA